MEIYQNNIFINIDSVLMLFTSNNGGTWFTNILQSELDTSKVTDIEGSHFFLKKFFSIFSLLFPSIFILSNFYSIFLNFFCSR